MEYTPLAGSTQANFSDSSYAPYRIPSSRSHESSTWSKSKWPVESQKLSRLTPARISLIIGDSILASAPLIFIVLAIIAAGLDGKPVSDYGLHLRHVLLLSPTIFPIIFAALMGRCFRSIGLYRAERGISLIRLEQLIGCQSLFAALERLFALRAFSLVGIIMTLVWLLSPLGGQAALRLMSTAPDMVQTNGTVYFLNPNAYTDSALLGASAVNSARATFTSIFLASLLSSVKYQNTPMDLWGNVKIPAINSISGPADSGGWLDVNHSANVTYASLIGIPVANVPSTGTSNFSLTSRYFSVNCTKNVEVGIAAFGNVTQTWKLLYNSLDCHETWPCSLDVQSLDSTGNITQANCTIAPQYIESIISCTGQACGVDKLRMASEPADQDRENYIQHLLVNEMAVLPTVDNYDVGSAGERGSTNMEKWMYDPYSFIGDTYDNVDLWRLTPDLLAQRLNIVINTFFQSTFATTALAGNLPQNLSSLATGIAPALTFNASASQVVEQTADKYQCDWMWIAILLAVSAVLQIFAYTGLVLKYITLAPDILGYVSSLTLLNPYVPVPTGGTTLDGLQRASLLRDIRLKIGDVCANEPHGAIAIASADRGTVGKLTRTRWYI
ncbi:hypothetical protein K432DRAFT_422421 [Lepidopterella palustris CBS 459.81]|uniref:Uncharacterized protein n=1 Tax=Lepidopterella palustris CBS 459.81 TaxID=1314670 RepID=A0A8E2JJT2_9PEZI|nr:hypothetical protein K432DRAFT_422421 [Lepidopterella palustris CBS 459.81]